MKKYIALLGILIVSHSIYAQISERALRKLEREAEKKEKEEKDRRLAEKMIKEKVFVIEADYLSNNRGDRYVVNPNINFVKVEDGQATIQIGSNVGLGYNGLGGITTSGKISSWESKERKNGGYYVSFNVTTSIGHYHIRMDIGPDRFARATLSGLRGGSLVYEGEIVPLYASRIYKGSDI